MAVSGLVVPIATTAAERATWRGRAAAHGVTLSDGPGGGSGWLDRSARKCPRVDARDWLLFTVEGRARSTVSSRRMASTVQTTPGSRLSQTCSRR